MSTHDVLPAMAEARQRFMELVAEVRPELHRYCARMAGSVFDGEDIVQDTLAKAYYALAQMEEPPPLRPWLFRIAHNTAMDFLRRYEHQYVEPAARIPDWSDEDREVDPALVEAALSVFVSLPPLQRSALALKDVLGHSLEEIAETMGISVGAVKAALSRARAGVAASVANSPVPTLPPEDRAALRRYADLFNARNWDALRALFDEETRLDLVSRQQRKGATAARYWTRYAEIADLERLRAEPGFVDGLPVVAILRPPSERPAYFVQLTWQHGAIALIRDFYYVPYIAEAARFTPAD